MILLFYPGYYGDHYHVNPHIARHLIYSANTKYLEVPAHDKTVVNHARGYQENKNKTGHHHEDVLPQPYNVVKSDHTDGIKQNDNNLHKRRNGDGKTIPSPPIPRRLKIKMKNNQNRQRTVIKVTCLVMAIKNFKNNIVEQLSFYILFIDQCQSLTIYIISVISNCMNFEL